MQRYENTLQNTSLTKMISVILGCLLNVYQKITKCVKKKKFNDARD